MSAFKKSHPITGYKWSGRGCELCFMTSKPPPFTVINPATHDEGRGEMQYLNLHSIYSHYMRLWELAFSLLDQIGHILCYFSCPLDFVYAFPCHHINI